MSKKVALDAIYRDSLWWRESAKRLAAAARSAQLFAIAPGDFSHQANLEGAAKTYEEARELIARLLGEGAEFFDEIEAKLMRILSTYENSENEQRERVDRVQRGLEG